MSNTATIQPFCFEGNEVRTVVQDSEPWFIAKDVCDVLEIKNPTQAVQQLDEDERSMFYIGRQGETNIISESGLYTLVIRSNKPQAKPFRRWVTHEVLPSIRKTGSYNLPKKKEVLVNHNHQRISETPGGLDIRYNLDLTKVISKPTPAGLEILERLTGISFADIDLGGQSLESRTQFQMFVEQNCVKDVSARVKTVELHTAYNDWCDDEADKLGSKVFSSVAQEFFRRIKSSGLWFYVGLKLK